MSEAFEEKIEAAERAIRDGQPPEQKIEGTQWLVDLYEEADGFAIKAPRNPSVNTTKELHGRHVKTIKLMRTKYYEPKGIDKIPVPKMALINNGQQMVQERVYGRTLDELTEDEIKALPAETLMDLWLLLDCALKVNSKNGRMTDFVDLPGYNFKLHPLKRIIRALQARYSINIMIGNDNQLYFVDPDLYYASTRTPLTKASAASMKPLMMLLTRVFRDQIGSAIYQ
jgi:hypothetical protein